MELESDLRARFDALIEKPHPRLVTNNDTLPDTGPLEGFVAEIIKEADALCAVAPLGRVMEGRRLLAVSREALRRMQILSVAWMRGRDRRHLERAEAELLAVCAFEDWNPDHYLDTAEMMLGVSFGYDILYNALSPESRETIAGALWRLGLSTALDNKQWWVRSNSNWGQVCHAGATAAAVVLAGRHPEEAFAVMSRAYENIRIPMGEYGADGVYPEGPMYWDYGTSFNVIWFIIAGHAPGTVYDIGMIPGFAESAGFVLHTTAPSGYCFNFADCSLGRRNFPALLWFAERYPELYGGAGAGVFATEWGTLAENPRRYVGNRVAPLICLFGLGGKNGTGDPTCEMKQSTQAGEPVPLDYVGHGPSEIVTMRSAWDDPKAWYVGIKAGTPSAPHGHMDTGSFILEAKGVRWACEAGMENYHNLEKIGFNLWDGKQDGDRWNVFRYGAVSHNIIRINDGKQNVKSHVRIDDCDLNVPSPGVRLDLTPAYGRPVTREFVFRGRSSLEITDTVGGLGEGDVVRFQMLTKAAPAIGGSVLTLTQDGETLTLEAPGGAVWQSVEASALRNAWDTPEKEPDYKVVYFEIRVAADGPFGGVARQSNYTVKIK